MLMLPTPECNKDDKCVRAVTAAYNNVSCEDVWTVDVLAVLCMVMIGQGGWRPNKRAQQRWRDEAGQGQANRWSSHALGHLAPTSFMLSEKQDNYARTPRLMLAKHSFGPTSVHGPNCFKCADLTED